MKVLGYSEYSSRDRNPVVIVQMFKTELCTIIGRDSDKPLPCSGTELNIDQRINTCNEVLRNAGEAKQTAKHFRALAELIEATIPQIESLCNPPQTSEAPCPQS